MSVLFSLGGDSFNQYIPSKRHRFGIKFFVICDCKTGYVLDFVIYTGTDVDVAASDPHGFSGAVVKKLMDNYFNRNHILYTDNYYTSPALSKFLLENKTGSCGTVCNNRKGWPAFPANTARGECRKKKCGDMLAIHWHDKRVVKLLSTVHMGELQDSGKIDHQTGLPRLKPDAVKEYNKNMRLVDKSDMMISSIDCLRKILKWYKKAFFHLLNITVLNSYILYQQLHPKEKLSLRMFELKLAKQLLEEYGTVLPQGSSMQASTGRPDRFQARDWLSRHYLSHLPELPSGRPGSRRCHVCAHTTRRAARKKETRFWCNECQVPLCPTECFRDYHTRQNL